MERYDIVILGGGSAGFAAALKASELGAEVAICEEWVIGGTCLNRGCIPSKNLLKASEVLYYAHHQAFRGIEIPKGKINLAEVIKQKDELVQELRQEKYLNILRDNRKIHYFEGKASFLSRDEVSVGGHLLKGEKFIIATGARPQVIPFHGIEKIDYLNSTTALNLKVLPASMIILGGRFVAVEMAQIFSHFGTKVIILQRSPRIIPEEEEEISDGLRRYMEEEGIGIHTGVKVIELFQRDYLKYVKVEVGGEVKEFKGETILIAAGNTPNTDSLHLGVAGVEMDERGFIKTDECMRTSNPKIFAAGDVVGVIQLVTVAAHEGSISAQNAIDGNCSKKVDYIGIPHAIFTHPNVASVGLSERQATERGIRIMTRTLDMSSVPKARAIRDERGIIKIIAEEGTGTILGIHILSPDAAEIIHQGVLLVRNRMTVRDAIDKIDVYPTLSEMIKLCSQSFYKDVGKLSCCAE
jgi:mercuric reductase